MTRFATPLFAAASILATAAPAFAAPAKVAANPTKVAAVAVDRNQRYCSIETLSGSNVQRKFCLTRDGWKLQGADPLKA